MPQRRGSSNTRLCSGLRINLLQCLSRLVTNAQFLVVKGFYKRGNSGTGFRPYSAERNTGRPANRG
jgi:hypothetical protein